MADQRLDITAYGPTDLADIALCKRVYDVLQQAYPGYEWMTHADHSYQVGQVVISLPYSSPKSHKNWGYVLNIPDVERSDGDDYVRRAGGELLERFNMPRSRAPIDAAVRMIVQGIITDNPVRGKDK